MHKLDHCNRQLQEGEFTKLAEFSFSDFRDLLLHLLLPSEELDRFQDIEHCVVSGPVSVD